VNRLRLGLSCAGVSAAVLSVTAVPAEFAIAQGANSNAGLECGQDHLFDATLGTPNRKTPVPQDNNLATAPGATQAASMRQSKTKLTGTLPVINHISQGGHR
jgi:hypothetical protein